MKDKKGFWIEGKGYGIDKDEDSYIHYHWGKGVSFWLDKDEMEEFLETITDEEYQKKMKEELILIRLQNEVEKQMKESIRGKKETEVCMS